MTALLAIASASHATFTLATFADPSNGNPFLFKWDTVNNTLSGSWTNPGLNLDTPGFTGGGSVANAKFTMNPVNLTTVIAGSLYTMGAGSVNFTDASNNNVLTIGFSGGVFLNPLNAGAASSQGHAVTFSGPNVPGNLTNQSFSFSFANPTVSGTDVYYTASFTSSADVVPEPATLLAVGAGLAAFIRRRKAA